MLGLENSNSSFSLGLILVWFFFPSLIYPFATGLSKDEVISNSDHSMTFLASHCFCGQEKSDIPSDGTRIHRDRPGVDTVTQLSRFKIHLGLYEQNVPWHM